MISSIVFEIVDYLENSGQDPYEWDYHSMAAEIDGRGLTSIDDLDIDEFTDLLQKYER